LIERVFILFLPNELSLKIYIYILHFYWLGSYLSSSFFFVEKEKEIKLEDLNCFVFIV